MDSTALAAAVTALVGMIGAFVESIRRGAWVPRFAYDRESARADASDLRADKLETAVEVLTRAVEDQGRTIADQSKLLAEWGPVIRTMRDERKRAGAGGSPT